MAINLRITILALVITSVLLPSCATSKWELPAGYPGHWHSGREKNNGRTHGKNGYAFTSDSAEVTLEISVDKTASGKIGMAGFSHAAIIRNAGNAETTGVAYIIRCGHIGKIFSGDPLDDKEVELWLSPLKEEMVAELRYTEGLSVFPMGKITFRKE